MAFSKLPSVLKGRIASCEKFLRELLFIRHDVDLLKSNEELYEVYTDGIAKCQDYLRMSIRHVSNAKVGLQLIDSLFFQVVPCYRYPVCSSRLKPPFPARTATVL